MQFNHLDSVPETLPGEGLMSRARCAGLVAAAVAGAAVAAAGGSAAKSPYGVGLKLGAVVHSIRVGSAVGPWLVWNSKSCKYEVAKSHPAAYKAVVRKVVGGPRKIGYMHYGD